MRDVFISSGSDLAQLNGASDVRAVFRSGIVYVPNNFTLRNCKNVFLDGTTAPKGRVCLTGWPLQVIDSNGFEAKKVCFHVNRPTSMPAELYEKWWSSPRFLSTRENASSDVRLTFCETRGNTDEIAFYGDYVPVQGRSQRWGKNVVIEDCLIGPSVINRTPSRKNHNFGLMPDGVDDVQIRRCLFVGHNRRSVQQRGARCLIEHCHFFSYGTMAVGFHAGTSAEVYDCVFQPTAMTPSARPFPIKAVEGTIPAFAEACKNEWPSESLIHCKIDQCKEIGSPKHLNPRDNWNLWGWNDLSPTGVPYEDTMRHWGGLPSLRTQNSIDLQQIGVQDQMTKGILTSLSVGQYAWLNDVPVPKPSDY